MIHSSARTILVLAALGVIAFISRDPELFGWATFGVSIIVLGRIELDKNQHDISFYYYDEPTQIAMRWIRSFGLVEAAGKSIVFGLLATFLLLGRSQSIRSEISLYFLATVIAGYLVLCSFRRVKGLDIIRWSYTRCAVLLGLTFSVFMARVHEVTYPDLVILLTKARTGRLDTPFEVARFVHGIAHKLNGHLIENALTSAFNSDIVGSTISFVLTTDVIFGFVVLPYSVLLLLLAPPSRFAVAPRVAATSVPSSSNTDKPS